MKSKNIATIYAILAAALYAINIPVSKLLLNHAGATITAAFLYLGAGIGLLITASILLMYGILNAKKDICANRCPTGATDRVSYSKVS